MLSHPKPTPDVLPRQPELRVIESRQRQRSCTCSSISSETRSSGRCGPRYPYRPMLALVAHRAVCGWTIVLALHLWRAYVQTTWYGVALRLDRLL